MKYLRIGRFIGDRKVEIRDARSRGEQAVGELLFNGHIFSLCGNRKFFLEINSK